MTVQSDMLPGQRILPFNSSAGLVHSSLHIFPKSPNLLYTPANEGYTTLDNLL